MCVWSLYIHHVYSTFKIASKCISVPSTTPSSMRWWRVLQRDETCSPTQRFHESALSSYPWYCNCHYPYSTLRFKPSTFWKVCCSNFCCQPFKQLLHAAPTPRTWHPHVFRRASPNAWPVELHISLARTTPPLQAIHLNVAQYYCCWMTTNGWLENKNEKVSHCFASNFVQQFISICWMYPRTSWTSRAPSLHTTKGPSMVFLAASSASPTRLTSFHSTSYLRPQRMNLKPKKQVKSGLQHPSAKPKVQAIIWGIPLPLLEAINENARIFWMLPGSIA